MDVDWRVDVKTSANTVSRMATPTALVQMQVSRKRRDIASSYLDARSLRQCAACLQVARPSVQEGVVGKMETVNFEASKETLQTMLDGLGAGAPSLLLI